MIKSLLLTVSFDEFPSGGFPESVFQRALLTFDLSLLIPSLWSFPSVFVGLLSKRTKKPLLTWVPFYTTPHSTDTNYLLCRNNSFPASYLSTLKNLLKKNFIFHILIMKILLNLDKKNFNINILSFLTWGLYSVRSIRIEDAQSIFYSPDFKYRQMEKWDGYE